MNKPASTLACLPMFNSYGLLARVLTGDGEEPRSFQSEHGLYEALLAAGIQSEELQESLSALEVGSSFDVPVTSVQRTAFFAHIRPTDLHGTERVH